MVGILFEIKSWLEYCLKINILNKTMIGPEYLFFICTN